MENFKELSDSLTITVIFCGKMTNWNKMKPLNEKNRFAILKVLSYTNIKQLTKKEFIPPKLSFIQMKLTKAGLKIK